MRTGNALICVFLVLLVSSPASIAHTPSTKLVDLEEEPTVFVQLDPRDAGEQARVYAGAPCERTDLEWVDAELKHTDPDSHRVRIRFAVADVGGSCPGSSDEDVLWYGYGLTAETADWDRYTVVYWHSGGNTLGDHVSVIRHDNDGDGVTHEEHLCPRCLGPINATESTVTLRDVWRGDPPFRDASLFAVSCTVPTLGCNPHWTTTSSTLTYVDVVPSLHDTCLFCSESSQEDGVWGLGGLSS